MADEREVLAEEGLAEQGTTSGDEPTGGRENTMSSERGVDGGDRVERQSADSAAGESRSLADDMDRALRARSGDERGEVH
jgi:hypothetical protein